jgi:hypothetical protein
MADRSRELVDITQQEYFIDLEKRYFPYETSDELIKKRYEKDFIKTSYLTKREITDFSLEYNKFITFEIEGVIQIRMAIPLRYVQEKGVIYCPIEQIEDKEKPLLSSYLKNATLKSIDFSYVDNEILYDGMSTVLNGIRRKFSNTIYRGTNLDFIEDFFESFYKKHIVEIVINLANSHFEEAEVKKYGNSYSILYRDLENFKTRNPHYDENDLDEKIYSTFTKASIPFEFENIEVDDIRFSEIDTLNNFRLRALMVEEEAFEDFDISDNTLPKEEFEERSLFIMPVIEFKNEIYSISDEDFTPELAGEICNFYGVNEKFYERTKSLEVMLESPSFLKYSLEHYLSLMIFFGNMANIKSEIEKLKEEENFENEIIKQNENLQKSQENTIQQ